MQPRFNGSLSCAVVLALPVRCAPAPLPPRAMQVRAQWRLLERCATKTNEQEFDSHALGIRLSGLLLPLHPRYLESFRRSARRRLAPNLQEHAREDTTRATSRQGRCATPWADSVGRDFHEWRIETVTCMLVQVLLTANLVHNIVDPLASHCGSDRVGAQALVQRDNSGIEHNAES